MCDHHNRDDNGATTASANCSLIERRDLVKASVAAGLAAGAAILLRMLPNLAPVLDRAGSGAWEDMWRVAPPLAAVALALKALGIRPRGASVQNKHCRGLSPITRLG
jgi:hypothetical protein